MMRAMLADRFKLVAHVEKRPHDVYDLVLARSDGRLGAGLMPIEKDCAPLIAAQRAAFEAGGPPMPISGSQRTAAALHAAQCQRPHGSERPAGG